MECENCERRVYKIVTFEEWKETLENILSCQKGTIDVLLEELSNADNNHPKMLVPYVKQFLFEKLKTEYLRYVDNTLMLKVGSRLKDFYYFALNQEGLPMLVPKKPHDWLTKQYKGGEVYRY